jgi:signal transduction histidine kinase
MDLSHRSVNESEKMTALVQLAGTVAHELNNIFTAVTGNLSLLDQEIAGANNQSLTVKDIVRAAQRGIDLTSKLQAFAGRQRLHRRNIELNAVVARTLGSLRQSLTGVSIEIALANSECIVYADEQKLSDTIIELVRNARDAMPLGQGNLTIKTERRQQGRPRVLLSIADNGCGMAPEVAARAMEPLFTTSPHGIKAGWGLSNCAGFIRQSGGAMTLASEPGRGTTVEISLPLENA